ncbi:MAG TPA: FtsX-like permease family protein [Candidatus Thermoplasmatota archaeon]
MISLYVRRRLLQSRGRTVISLLAIFNTIAVTVLIGVLFGSGQQSFVGFFTERADYDLLVTEKGNGSLSRPFFRVADVEANLTGHPQEAVYPVISTITATFHTQDGNLTFVPLFGVPPAYDRGHVEPREGNYSISGSDVVLSSSAARRLNVSVGDTLPLLFFEGAVDYSEINQSDFGAILPYVRETNLTVAGVADISGRFPGAPSFYIVRGYAETAAMLNTTGLANQVVVLLPESFYDFTDTRDPARAATAAGTAMATALGPSYHVEAVKATALRNAVETARATSLIAQMFAVIFPAITGILVASTLNLSVEEKARDLAIMRLVGARRRDVGRVLLLEAGILLAVGVPLGLAVGLAMPPWIVQTFFEGDAAVTVSWATVAQQLAIALGVTGLFLLLPLRRALSTTPAQAVYQARFQGEYRFAARRGVDVRLVMAGAILFLSILYATFIVPYILVFNQTEFFQFFLGSTIVLIAALSVALLWVAPPLEELFVRAFKPLTRRYNTLTVANVRRNVRRNASTNLIFSLIVGIMLFFTSFFAGIISSVDLQATYSVGSDVRLAAFDSFSPAFVDSVSSFQNVSEVAVRPVGAGAVATNLVRTRGASLGLIGLDPRLPDVLLPGTIDVVEGSFGTLRALDDRSIVLSALTATRLDLHAGDLVSIERGAHRDFFLVALVLRSLPGFVESFQDQEGLGASPGAFVTMDRYFEFTGGSALTVRYSDIYVRAAPGADTEQMAQDFQDLYGIFVDFAPISKDAVVAQARQFVSFITFVSEVILVFLILVAVFSLTVNLYASVKERAYEIGVVRSLGLRRRGVLGSTLLEGLSISFVSAAVGVAIGVLISFFVIFFFNIFSPIDLAYEVPRDVLLVLLVATATFAAAGSLLPARSVAKVPLISLLRKVE